MNQIIAGTKWHGDTKPWFTKQLWFYTISALFVIIEKKKMGKTNCLDKYSLSRHINNEFPSRFISKQVKRNKSTPALGLQWTSKPESLQV